MDCGRRIEKASNASQASASVTGDPWVDTDNPQLYLYTGLGWTLVGPNFPRRIEYRCKCKNNLIQDNIDYNVLQIEVEAKPIAIISTKTFFQEQLLTDF